MSFKVNPLTAVDSYKLSHRQAYPEGTTHVYSNFTPRSVRHLNVPEKYKDNKIVWFGGQAILQDMIDMWNDEFFNILDTKDPAEYSVNSLISDFSKRIAPFAGADYDVSHLYELHKLGHLPLKFKMLPEGSLVPVGVPVLTVENTDPRFAWLTNYIETYLSAELWKPSTSATIARYYRMILEAHAEKTSGNKDFIDFQAHDFSYRGMSGSLDAAKSGAGHLLYFKGTDTIPAVDYLAYHYNGDDTFIGASVPATEHSVQCSYQDDYAYIKHLVTEVFPSGIVSVVSDGYDYWKVLTDVLPRLKDEILARPVNELGMSKVVIRPDSGDPVRIIAGYRDDEYNSFQNENGTITYYNVDTSDELTKEEIKGSIQVLWELFGGTINEKGYKTLDSHIGLIYGDSITLERADEILERLAEKGFASDNVVFGVGSYTYQYNTRDTLGFAMKATNITVNGVDTPLFKDPKTDDGTKKSAKGLLRVVGNIQLVGNDTNNQGDGFNLVKEYQLISNVSREEEDSGSLETVYDFGEFVKFTSLDDIRSRVSVK